MPMALVNTPQTSPRKAKMEASQQVQDKTKMGGTEEGRGLGVYQEPRLTDRKMLSLTQVGYKSVKTGSRPDFSLGHSIPSQFWHQYSAWQGNAQNHILVHEIQHGFKSGTQLGCCFSSCGTQAHLNTSQTDYNLCHVGAHKMRACDHFGSQPIV